MLKYGIALYVIIEHNVQGVVQGIKKQKKIWKEIKQLYNVQYKVFF